METALIIVLAAFVLLAISTGAVLLRRATSFERRVDRRREQRRRFEAAWGAVLQEADDRAAIERGRRERPDGSQPSRQP